MEPAPQPVMEAVRPEVAVIAAGWDDLPAEVLLRICLRLDWRSLVRLGGVSRILREPVACGSEDEALSLPEQAARRLAEEDSLLRPGARREGESWRETLCLLHNGLYRSGVLGRTGTEPFCLLKQVVDAGWIVAYEAEYSHRTSDEDLERVPDDARDVLVAAVAARNPADQGARAATSALSTLPAMPSAGASSFTLPVAANDGSSPPTHTAPPELHLAAWGPRDIVLRETHSDETFGGGASTIPAEDVHCGVYFYRWPGSSVGFSAHPDLHLWRADAGIKQLDQTTTPEQASDTRLSWNLDEESTGGWRAGTFIELGQRPVGWQKLLYYRMATTEIDQLERCRLAEEELGRAVSITSIHFKA